MFLHLTTYLLNFLINLGVKVLLFNKFGGAKVLTKEENVAIFRRYIAEISCVEGYRHDFSYRNIGQTIFLDKSREIGDFSSIYRLVNAGQRSQRATVKVKCATVSPLQCTSPNKLLPRGFGLGFSLLAIWANSPLWYKVH